MTDRITTSFTVNDTAVSVETEPRHNLADALRDELGLTGTHLGCEHGVCGACTVLMDGSAVRSCLILTPQAEGARIETVEGLASDGELHPLQEGFHKLHGLQCGFCTPGILMAAKELLRELPNPSESQIRERLSGNICRCTGYVNIVEAVQYAAEASGSDRLSHDGPEERKE